MEVQKLGSDVDDDDDDDDDVDVGEDDCDDLCSRGFAQVFSRAHSIGQQLTSEGNT